MKKAVGKDVKARGLVLEDDHIFVSADSEWEHLYFVRIPVSELEALKPGEVLDLRNRREKMKIRRWYDSGSNAKLVFWSYKLQRELTDDEARQFGLFVTCDGRILMSGSFLPTDVSEKYQWTVITEEANNGSSSIVKYL